MIPLLVTLLLSVLCRLNSKTEIIQEVNLLMEAIKNEIMALKERMTPQTKNKLTKELIVSEEDLVSITEAQATRLGIRMGEYNLLQRLKGKLALAATSASGDIPVPTAVTNNTAAVTNNTASLTNDHTAVTNNTAAVTNNTASGSGGTVEGTRRRYRDDDDSDDEQLRRSVRAKNVRSLMANGVINDPFRLWALLPGEWPSANLDDLVVYWRILLPGGNPHVWEEMETLVSFATGGTHTRSRPELIQFSVRMLTLLAKLRFPLFHHECRELIRQKLLGDKEQLTDAALFRIAEEAFRALEEKTRAAGPKRFSANSNNHSSNTHNHNNNASHTPQTTPSNNSTTPTEAGTQRRFRGRGGRGG